MTEEDPAEARQAPIAPEQARSMERRTRLLQTALHLLLTVGGAGVTHRRVAEESGSSPGAVRYYFRTREDLLAACLDQIEHSRKAVAEQILSRAEAHSSPEQVAGWALAISCGTNLDDATMTGTIWSVMDCARESPRLARMLGEYREVEHRELAELLARCGYGSVAPSIVTAVLDGSLLSTTLEGGSGAAATARAKLSDVLRLAENRSNAREIKKGHPQVETLD